MLSRFLRKSLNTTKDLSKRCVFQHRASNRNIANTEEMRSQLFASRRRIPGRKIKFFMLAAMLGMALNSAKIREIRGYFSLREKEHARLQRKAIPFFQAMEDLRWLALDDRLKMVNDALFEDKSKKWLDTVMKRYHVEEDQFWARYLYRHGFQQQGAPRNVVPYSQQFGFRICHGYEIPNI